MRILKNRNIFKEINSFTEFLEYINTIEKNPVKEFQKLKNWFEKNKNKSFNKSKFNFKIIQKDIFGKSIRSQFSVDYWTQRGYSENEARIKISELQKENANKNSEKMKSLSKDEYNKIYATSSKEHFQYKYGSNWKKYYEEYNKKRTDKSLKTKIEYWINKGYSENEARIKVSERQSTFSLNKLIKKFGDKKGKEIFNKRQQIWQQSYQKTCNEKYGVPFYILSDKYSNLSPITKSHKEIIDFIKEHYNGEIKINDRKTISPLELDIYLPELNFAIEFNGMYWHSNIDKNYHLMKTELCEEKDIHLFHIFENEWNNHILQDIWKSKILYKLNKIENKIYARKCIIKEISKNEEMEFLEYNHLQGYTPSKIKLGMFFENELVSVLTIGKSRFKKNEFELLRFATKNYTIVVGAFSKFLKHLKKFNLDNLYSYGNRRWTFKNNVYSKYSNTELIDITKPNYFYIKNNQIYNRMNFQKHKLSKILDTFDPNLSEIDNVLNNEYRIIFDCGNFKYKIF